MKYLVSIILFTTLLFSSDLGWSSDYEKALIQAKKENKFVYVLITSDSCRWCRKFEQTTLLDMDIEDRLEEEYITLHLSRDQHKIPGKFKTSPVPRHYFLDQKGDILYDTLGYRDVEMFNSFMDNAKERYISKNRK
ncbi:MAG: thioredoxin family protein [Sulfurimonas sp.]|nr:thioredoxin family protein [Sulfurimonas sp.]